MTRTHHLLLVAVAALLMCAGTEAADLQLKHQALGTNCAACHKGGPGIAPKTEDCFGCHGSYQALAEKSQAVKPNPHLSHMGELRCSVCHREHQPSKVFCNDCHTFESLKIK